MTDQDGGEVASDAAPPPEWHYRAVANEMLEGRVVVVLGAAVNLPTEAMPGQPPAQHLPLADDLAKVLGNEYVLPWNEGQLARVAQSIVLFHGREPLNEALRRIFSVEQRPTSVHQMLAEVWQTLETRIAQAPNGFEPEDPLRCPLLMITTNFDHLLERAFERDGYQPCRRLCYVADGPDAGSCLHYEPAPVGPQEPEMIRDATDWYPTDGVPVIVKLHGEVASRAEHDSYVIAEDDYIDFMSHNDPELQRFLPPLVRRKLLKSYLLFLGYGLKDWNLRVMVRRIWQQRGARTVKSWSVQWQPDDLDCEMWAEHGVKVFNVDIGVYVRHLREAIQQARLLEQ